MPRRAFLFVIANIIISVGVAFAIISLNPGTSDGGGSERLVTFVVVVTGTPDPNATLPVRIITATPNPNQTNNNTDTLPDDTVEIPDDLFDDAGPQSPLAPTIDPTQLNDNPELADAAANLPANCIPHVIQDGEFPGLVAQTYGVDVNALLQASGLTEDDAFFLQIGDILIVPLEGCELGNEPIVVSDGNADDETDSAEATEETDPDNPDVTAQPTVVPTITLAPTAIDAQVEITEVVGVGDITSEAVEILNTGNTINISGWTLTDSNGNEFVFPEGRRLFSNASVTVNSRSGQGTPVILFWGEETAVYESGETIVLADADGEAQATFTIP